LTNVRLLIYQTRMTPSFLKIIVAFLLLTAVASASDHQDLNTLIREQSKLERKVSSLFRKNKLYLNKEYNALAEKSLAASKALIAARTGHPDLKVRNEQHDQAQDRLMKALEEGATDRNEIRDQYYQAREALEVAANQIPEIVKLHEKVEAMNELIFQKKKELLLQTPDGKILMAKIEAKGQKIEDLREQLRMAELKKS